MRRTPRRAPSPSMQRACGEGIARPEPSHHVYDAPVGKDELRGVAIFALVLVGCQSSVAPGAACTRASDCASPLTCTFGRCRASCVENRDCPAGSSCLPSATGNACTVETDLGCETGVGRMCATGLVCVA